MTEVRRPSPDDLLRGIQKSTQSHAGQLRVFFGMCAGVGKTYAMLKAAQEKASAGLKVIVGLIETHQRQETAALLEGFVLIPKKKMKYKDTMVEEMDLDQILREQPDLVLVDELPHTNMPGSRHQKRYQDIEELLNAGINVYTTLNVQHVESRNDLVQTITGIVVRETVPDSFLQRAQQIQLIDISTQELLKRLKEGKVYLGDRADIAAENFFKEEHLTALRELALRFIAEIVDVELKDQMTVKRLSGWNTNERFLVAVGHRPFSANLLRSARRMAYTMNAPWIALNVNTGEELGAKQLEMLSKNLALARELGAEVVTTKDANFVKALKQVIEERNVTQIVVGQPNIKSFFRKKRNSVLEQLLKETVNVDIHVIRQESEAVTSKLSLKLPKVYFRTGLLTYFLNLIFISAVTLLCYKFIALLGYRAVGFIFLMAIVLVSVLTTIGPTLFTTIISSLAWNYFFIEPRFTFAIRTYEDIMMGATFFVVAVISGLFTTRIRKQEADLRQREYRTRVLFEIGKEFAAAKGERDIASIAARYIKQLFSANVCVFKSESERVLAPEPINFSNIPVDSKENAMANWSLVNKKKAGWGTDTLKESVCQSIPLLGRSEIIGVLLFYPTQKKKLLVEQEGLLYTIVNYFAIALEREILETKSRNSKLLEDSERLYQTILNSVSHELRTPLTSIIGTATALQDSATLDNPETRKPYMDDLIDSADRLNHVIENLLEMSRLDSGVLSIKKEIVDIHDLIQSTLQRQKRSLRHHKIELNLYKDPLYCHGDYRLLEHAFINLVLNAVTYSPKDQLIEIATSLKHKKQVIIEIKDRGKGVPEDSLPKIFNKFYRVPGSPAGGMGLGLSIVRDIVEIHHGNVYGQNRKDGPGAIFTLELDSVETPLSIKES
ncbi:MAG: sensor histidine kinase KdpD [Bdellovibrio sp.]|nr:sensor histidine kinase KdpD [Bdellovibrio sp.]